jgi:murein DD-endopeptidase MepM/ murein hydrolase activator NlpD
MSKIILQLPTSYRLKLNKSKSRVSAPLQQKSFISSLTDIKHTRSGNSTPVIVKQAQAPLVTHIDGTRLPVQIMKVTQKFYFYHQGVDFDGESGDIVTPVKSGTVTQVIYSKFSYGNHVIIDHGNGLTSLYAHLSKIFVKEGDSVTIDQHLGLMGSTGRSTGSHLHLEVRENGKAIDPLKVIVQ